MRFTSGEPAGDLARFPDAERRPAAPRRLASIIAVMAIVSAMLACGPTTARSAEPIADDTAAVETRSVDVAVIGGTPGGVAMAIRAAREGQSVLLVHHTSHLGGMLSNGLGVWDTLYEGRRSPIYDELRAAMQAHYRDTYGPESQQYRDSLPGKTGHNNAPCEPRVAERLITAMVAREPRIMVLTGYYPSAAVKQAGADGAGALITSLTLTSMDGRQRVEVAARVYGDATYEGDLVKVAGAPYRVGRESRAEFQEPHAGVIYMRATKTLPAGHDPVLEAEHARLKLRTFRGWQEIALPESTGAADGLVQAINYRCILSRDPTNRILPERPDDYDPAFLRTLEYGSTIQPVPNQKIGWNRPQLVGLHQDYIEGDWAQRQRVMDAHWQATVGLLYFLQHDPSVPADRRAFWQQYGFAKDEFADHSQRPHEIYVREARRIDGRARFTQHDGMLAAGSGRAPIQPDSITFTDWYFDTHACTKRRAHGSLDEGKMMLHHSTWPGKSLIVRCCRSASTTCSYRSVFPARMSVGGRFAWNRCGCRRARPPAWPRRWRFANR